MLGAKESYRSCEGYLASSDGLRISFSAADSTERSPERSFQTLPERTESSQISSSPSHGVAEHELA